MSRSTRLVREADLPAVSELLQRAFGGNASNASVELLRWKYLRAGPPWDGPRAFVVEQDGAIVAHAGFVPAVFRSPGREPVTSVVVTDWAAAPEAPGVGVALYAHVSRCAESAFLIGGVDVTRAIVPKLGFHPLAEATVFSRWIRPWREFRQREKSLRAIQRLGHAMLHRVVDRRIAPGAWTPSPVDVFDEQIDVVLRFRPSGRTTFQRTTASLNHMLGCPNARMRGYLLRDDSRVRGYAILASLGWEARLVDINIDSERLDDWTSAYGAAATIARRDPHVCRIRAMSAVPLLAEALRHNGFWINQREPFLLFARTAPPPALPIDVQFFESDLGYV